MKSSSFIRPRVNFVGSLHSTHNHNRCCCRTQSNQQQQQQQHIGKKKRERKEGRWRAGKSATGKQLQHNCGVHWGLLLLPPTVNEFFFSIGVAFPMYRAVEGLTWLSRLSSIVRCAYGERQGAERAVSFWCEKILVCSPQNVKGQRERERERKRLAKIT